VYRPQRYWEGRSAELIDTYDHPETWSERGWLRAGAEDSIVPELLHRYDCRRVLVPGAGTGRQYSYLSDFEVVGFDISPTLVSESCRRYPHVTTLVGEVTACDRVPGPFDAVVTSAVLAHVHPRSIRAAIQSIQDTARKLLIVREYTRLGSPAPYQFAHDYERLMRGWPVVHRETTDDRDGFVAELIAFEAPQAIVHGARPAKGALIR
jgi:SAM-dependent methyltransferase